MQMVRATEDVRDVRLDGDEKEERWVMEAGEQMVICEEAL